MPPRMFAHPNEVLSMAQHGEFQRIGGGFVQQAPSVEAQLRAAKQRVLELEAQLEQRTRQLSACHMQLTAETSARHTWSNQSEQLGRRLAALTGERERMAIQMAQLQERAQAAEEMVGQLRTALSEQQQQHATEQQHAQAQFACADDLAKQLGMEQLHAQALSAQQHDDLAILQEQLPQLRAAAAELPQLRAAAAELPALRAAVAEHRAEASLGFAARCGNRTCPGPNPNPDPKPNPGPNLCSLQSCASSLQPYLSPGARRVRGAAA